jgi:hypothetical protein
MGNQGLNPPKPHVFPSRKTSYQISSRRFGQPVSGLDSLMSRYVLFQQARCSLFLENISTTNACARFRGEERTDLTFSINPPPHHRLVCLPSEGEHIFHPDGCVIPDYHFMGAERQKVRTSSTEKPEAARTESAESNRTETTTF